MTDDDIKNHPIDHFLNDPSVKALLDSSVNIKEAHCKDFEMKIARYIDSTPVVSSTELGQSGPFWPLVKKITIYLKSQVLQSGVALFDVPGVGDTNTARSEQTDKILTNCNAMWIVTDINRAETDDISSGLLSQAMTRDLLVDGLYNAATFICTHADNPDCEDIIRRKQLAETNDECKSILDQIEYLNQSIYPSFLV